MVGQMKRLAFLPVLAAAVLASCAEGGRQVTEPTVAPSFSTTASSWRAVKGDDGVGAAVSVVVDGSGVSIDLGEHRLVVPAGAVAGPTVFTVVLAYEDAIGVEMTATSVGSAVLNDVGSAGFLKPLKLRLSYAQATETVDPSKLAIVWVKPDGSFEARRSDVIVTPRHVIADILHFSGYLIGTGDTCTDANYDGICDEL